MAWSTPWSRKRTDAYCEVFERAKIRTEPLEFLKALLTSQLGGKHKGLSIELVAVRRQTAFILSTTAESVICVDLMQSLILKTLFLDMARGTDYMTIAGRLKECGALALSSNSLGYALAYRAQTIAPGDHYRHDCGYLKASVPVIVCNRHDVGTDYFRDLIDTYLLSHELFHYLESIGHSHVPHFAAAGSKAFDYAVAQVCYENHPEFERLATYDGALALTPKALEEIRQDLRNRRRRYLEHRTTFCEEMACDAFAIEMFWFVARAMRMPEIMAFDRIPIWYSWLFHMANLHQAMNKRPIHSLKSSITAERPADYADSNLRRVAVTYLLGAHVAQQGTASTNLMECVNHIAGYIEPLRLAFEAHFVVPVTVAIRDCLLELERSSGRSIAPPAAAQETPLHELFDISKMVDLELRQKAIAS